MPATAIGIEALTLAPFGYHSLMVPSGTATLPELIGDRAIAFALAAALGMVAARVALPAKDYKAHISAMPYRTSILTTQSPRLLPPLTRRLNLDAEAGFQRKIQDVANKGNLKNFFHTQEVPPGQTFHGGIFGINGFDPFAYAGEDELVVRIGLHRNGMVRLRRQPVSQVRLNASTAAMFGRVLPVDRYCLHGLQLTPFFDMEQAAEESAKWN